MDHWLLSVRHNHGYVQVCLWRHKLAFWCLMPFKWIYNVVWICFRAAFHACCSHPIAAEETMEMPSALQRTRMKKQKPFEASPTLYEQYTFLKSFFSFWFKLNLFGERRRGISLTA
uniref:Uncharacterized protein n=1 Tax=Ditylenchus dipsaci TaxID=166011 RepID=A0A915EF32_9BILA